ncbi:MAG: flavoprotein [bacterium]
MIIRKWADLMVVCPLSANTMAKFVNGICDNLLTCVYRAWDFKKPVIIAPAMNTFMFENPIT